MAVSEYISNPYSGAVKISGHLILSDDEKYRLVQDEPLSAQMILPYTGGYEFINNKKRWCLWLKDINPVEIAKSKEVISRIEQTRSFRLKSKRIATNKLADTPTLFGEIRQPQSNYLIVPKVSSETRKYIPIDILKPNIISSGSALIVANATLLEFGVLTSEMHMTWVKYTCGRMKSDYQYSARIVYNNFSWPQIPSNKNKQNVEKKAQLVLDIRNEYPENSLADLYNPLTMPPKLVKAHQQLNRAVDLCYRPQAFTTESGRIEYLFKLYEEYIRQESAKQAI